MSIENLKVPLKDDGMFGMDSERCKRKKRSLKMRIFLGVCFLLIFNISMFIFTMFTFSQVKKLEKEVDRLKDIVSSSEVLDNGINAFLRPEDEGLYDGDPDLDPQPESAMFGATFEDDADYFFDYDNNYDIQNDTEEYADENQNIVKLAINLTKQGNESLREKRNIVAATQDGVIINSEPYAERMARNNTRHRNHPSTGHSVTPVTARPSYFGPTPRVAHHQDDPKDYISSPYVTPHKKDQVKHATKASSPVYIRRSRVMHTEDKSKAFRQVVRKSSLKSGDTLASDEEQSTSSEFTIVRDDNLGRRRYRQRVVSLDGPNERYPRGGRIKLATAHYNGDTSRYIVGQHTNFNGNGHLRHPQTNFVDWKISDWVKTAGMEDQFTMDEGVVTIKHSGIYFIYAQVYYLDEHDMVGFRVHKNSETILQCTITIHSSERRYKGNTCYTAGAEYLAEGDRISLADVSRERYSVFEPGKSFFGLVKLGDVKIK